MSVCLLGKSTLINIIIGLIPINSGKIFIYGNKITENNNYNNNNSNELLKIRENIGICFQSNILYLDLTVLQHLEIFISLKSTNNNNQSNSHTKNSQTDSQTNSQTINQTNNLNSNSNEMNETIEMNNKAKVLSMINEIDLFDKMNTPVKYLSGGQKRRLSLGIALIGNSKVILLDEPTSGTLERALRAIIDSNECND